MLIGDISFLVRGKRKKTRTLFRIHLDKTVTIFQALHPLHHKMIAVHNFHLRILTVELTIFFGYLYLEFYKSKFTQIIQLVKELNKVNKLKKINTKVVTIVVMVLSMLLAGGFAIDETFGGFVDLTPGGSPEEFVRSHSHTRRRSYKKR